MRTKLVATAASLVALGVAGLAAAAGPTSGDTRQAKATVVTVSMYEMGFKLNRRIVPRGPVVFRVANNGKVEHDFRLGARGTPVLDAGGRATLTVRFPKRGRFTFLCTVEGHAAAGMIGKLVVK